MLDIPAEIVQQQPCIKRTVLYILNMIQRSIGWLFYLSSVYIFPTT